MEENTQNLNGMPLPLLMDRARNETLTQVQNIMAKYQMPAFLYSNILYGILHVVNDAAVKAKEEAEQYWARKQAETGEKNKAVSKKEDQSKSAT